AVRLGTVGAGYLSEAEPAVDAAGRRDRRIVAQGGVLVDALCDVDPEAGDPAVEPEPQDPLELRVHGRLPPVQVRLGGQEAVQVVLAAGVVDRPGGRDGRA